MQLLFTIAICLFTLFKINEGGFDKTIIEKIDKIAERFITENKLPGLSLSVVHGSKAYSTGYGLRDLKRNLSVDNQTLFPIGSVTKSLTSMIVIKVLSEKFPKLGEAVMDTPIIQLTKPFYLNFLFIEKNLHDSITFRDLLAHRTCLQRADFPIFMGAYEDSRDYIYRTRYIPQVCSFRSKFVYNNAMYDLASYIIGLIAKKPFKNLVQDFFYTLGMTKSKFIPKNLNEYENVAQAYYRNKSLKSLDLNNYNRLLVEGSGGVLSCAEDMEKYIRFYLNEGKIENKSVLPKDVFYWIYLPSIIDEKEEKYYTLGLNMWVDKVDHILYFAHGGYLPTFSGLFKFLPQEPYKLGIYSVINSQDLDKDFVFTLDDLHSSIQQYIFNGLTNNLIHQINSVPNYDGLYINQKYIENEITIKTPQCSRDLSKFNGLFGNSYYGNFLLNFNGSTFSFSYGNYTTGFLHLHDLCCDLFLVKWSKKDEDYLKVISFESFDVFNLLVKFPNYDIMSLIALNETITFKRNATIDTFPEHPWLISY